MLSLKSLKNNYTANIILLFILIVQLFLMIHHGILKQGYHLDEFYSFELSNYSKSLYHQQEGFLETWHSGEFFQDVFFLSEEETFNYSIPYHAQERDVHPPLYYYIIHTLSSIFPSVFSKWIGLIPNFAFCLLTTVLLYSSSMKVNSNKLISLLIASVWGWSIGCMSTAMFIRMYAMLTCISTWLIQLHLQALKEKEVSKKSYTLLGMCTVIGLLTQYYFGVICLFVCTLFALFLLVCNRWKELSLYLATEFGAIAVSLLHFPAMLSHIFSGYRGKEALSNLANSDNYQNNFYEILSIISNDLFNGWIYEIMNFLVIGFVIFLAVCYVKNNWKFEALNNHNVIIHIPIKHELRKEFTFLFSQKQGILCALIVSILGYIALVVKIAPYQAARYYMCIYPTIVLFIINFVFYTVSYIIKNKKIVALFITVVFMFTTIGSYGKQDIDYLYMEREPRMSELEAYQKYPAVVLNMSSSDGWPGIWALEYMSYPAVYRCKQNDFSGILNASQTYDLSEGFCLYVYGTDNYSGDELFAEINEYIDVKVIDIVTTIHTPVYFCKLETN